jgi:hypothetical protein
VLFMDHRVFIYLFKQFKKNIENSLRSWRTQEHNSFFIKHNLKFQDYILEYEYLEYFVQLSYKH